MTYVRRLLTVEWGPCGEVSGRELGHLQGRGDPSSLAALLLNLSL